MRPALTMNVSPTSGVPIYRQLMDQVRAQIAGGRLSPGDFLPSVRQVAEELEVNPMTVSKAYSLLEKEQVVELVRGQACAGWPCGPGGTGRVSGAVRLRRLSRAAAR